MISCVLIFINFLFTLDNILLLQFIFLKIIKLHYCEKNYSKIIRKRKR